MNSVEVNEQGMLFDRCWTMVTPENHVVTQRDNLLLLKLFPKLNVKNGVLISVELAYEDKKIVFEPQKIGEIIEFECFKAMCEGIDEGENVSKFLESVFNQPYRLIRILKHRQMNQHPRYAALVSDNHFTNFTDSAQFLVVSEASYEKTRTSIPTELKQDLDIDAFRGNIIVRGVSAFEEDWWAKFEIGDIKFQGIARCPRCKVTTVNKKTLQYDPHFEPVNTLRKINGNGTKGYLGMHCIRHTNGSLKVGDPVIVKERKKFPDI